MPSMPCDDAEPTAGLAAPPAAGAGPPPLPAEFFVRDVVQVARELVGATLLVDGIGGVIVETEAYDRQDPASHSFSGPTARNAAMFGPPGCAYVYRSYGIHWCLNVVCGPAGRGAAVLVRALEPLFGLSTMRERRGGVSDRLLCAGPGRVCQALGVTRDQDGLPLAAPPFALLPRPEPAPALVAGPRIGISKAADQPWRFGLAGSPFLSRSFGRRPAAQ